MPRQEPSVVDPELVAVERAYRRAGRSVALVVVLAAVARTAEAGGGRGRDPVDLLAVLGLGLLLVVQRQPVHLHGAAEVDAAVREDREARLAVEQAVVADVRRAPRDLALLGVEQEGRDHELVLGKVVERADVDVGVALVDERRQDREAEDGKGDHSADHRTQAERRRFEELRARVADDLALFGFGQVGRDRRRRRCRAQAPPGNRS